MVEQLAGDDVADPVALLQHALDQQQSGVEQGGAKADLEIPPDDHIGVAGLVFQGEEDHPGGGAGALASGHQSGDANEAAIAQPGQIPVAGAAAQWPAATQQSHGVRSQGQASAVVVGEEIFADAGRRQLDPGSVIRGRDG